MCEMINPNYDGRKHSETQGSYERNWLEHCLLGCDTV
jgi:hypothetical protein